MTLKSNGKPQLLEEIGGLFISAKRTMWLCSCNRKVLFRDEMCRFLVLLKSLQTSNVNKKVSKRLARCVATWLKTQVIGLISGYDGARTASLQMHLNYEHPTNISSTHIHAEPPR